MLHLLLPECHEQEVKPGTRNTGALPRRNRFALTDLGADLRTGVPGSLHGEAIRLGEVTLPTWGGLLHTARTGQTAFDHVFGVDFIT